MKICFIATLVLALTLSTSEVRAQAASQENGFSIFAGAGTAFGLGAARLGYEHWEIGILNPHVLGAAKQMFSRETVYATFGFGLPLSLKPGLAVFGGLGWEPRMFWNVYFRAEMSTSAATNGETGGELVAGISLRF